MYFVILANDNDDAGALRIKHQKTHRERLSGLINEGRLLVAGPTQPEALPEFAGANGSLIIAEFASQQEAQSWIEDDIYFKEGVYANVLVKPFLPLLP